jgi:hypothetical protein
MYRSELLLLILLLVCSGMPDHGISMELPLANPYGTERGASRLPVDGGDVGKIFHRMYQVLRGGDFDQARSFMGSEATQNFFAFEEVRMQTLFCNNEATAAARIAGGYVCRDHATIYADFGNDDHATVEFIKEQGKWCFSRCRSGW